jgi:hypothetical protein
MSDPSQARYFHALDDGRIQCDLCIVNTPAGNIAATNVQGALNELDAEKLTANGAITSGSATKIAYDVKGLVTAGSSALLASADYVNQGTTTTVLHGNATGNPSWGQIINADVALSANIDASKLGSGDVTNIEFNYLDGVTSSIQTQLNNIISWGTTALGGKVDENTAISGATKTKITYDAKGLVTAGADATTADIAPSINRNYVNDAQLIVISNTLNTNSGDLTLGAIGSAPNANGASLTGQLLVLQPANALNGGVISTTAQTLAGAKTWNDLGTFNSGLIATGGNINLNSDATANNVNIGTATNSGTVTLSNAAGKISMAGVISGNNPLVFEGSTVDANQTTFVITNPTGTRTITFPDASGTVALATAGNSWNVDGNAGTNSAADFIGTTDAQDMVFKANNSERMRIEHATGFMKFGDATSGTIKATKELILREDGGTYGSSILRIKNELAENGAIFETTHATNTLVDFIFKTAANQRNIRFESRALAKTGSPSFHIGGATTLGVADPDNPTLSVGDNYSAFSKPLRIGNYSTPTALLNLAPGTSAANTAPLKFTSGPLLTTPEAGAIEFLNDEYYATITTGSARKTFAFLQSPSFTTPNLGAATSASLLSTGSISSSSATAGIGYSTGAGGTVLQSTNKSNAVTINKITGQITMNGAALAAASEVSFTVNNSSVTQYDVPVVAISANATNNTYLLSVTSVTNGSFRISVTNASTTPRSEALVINFAIIKGAIN